MFRMCEVGAAEEDDWDVCMYVCMYVCVPGLLRCCLARGDMISGCSVMKAGLMKSTYIHTYIHTVSG